MCSVLNQLKYGNMDMDLDIYGYIQYYPYIHGVTVMREHALFYTSTAIAQTSFLNSTLYFNILTPNIFLDFC